MNLRRDFSSNLVLLDYIIFSQLLVCAWTINTDFFPCDAYENSTKVDCSSRPLKSIPHIVASSVLSLYLDFTKIQNVRSDAFDGVPNLNTLEMMGNCQPGGLRAMENPSCAMTIHSDAFKKLNNLTSLNLSGNSLTSIPLLPERLQVLNLQNNRIAQITVPLNTPNLEVLLLSRNCFYANPCGQSFYINETVFIQLKKLKNLSLGYNNLTAVPVGLPSSLENLDLRENTITHILEGTFANLTALQSLNLEWNCQRCDHAARPCFPCPGNSSLALNSNSFYAKNSSITYLSLRGNSLNSIPPGLFRPLKNLKALDLSDNFLAYAIQNGTFFEELAGLTWISLIYNYEKLRTFPELNLSPSMENMRKLKSLLLSGNFFHKLSGKSFEVLSKLENLAMLELRMNFINECDVNCLTQLANLTRVDLSQNMLSFLPSWQASSSRIRRENYSQNKDFRAGSFQDHPPIIIDREAMSSSDTWKVSHLANVVTKENNEYQFPPPWHFQNICESKKTLDMSQNDIMRLNGKMFEGLENSVCLDLSYNYMSQTLSGGVFRSMKHLEFLNMSYNRLDLYHDDAFSEINSTLRVLDLSNNEFHFKMRGMGHRLGFLQSLTKLKVLSLANNGIGMRINQRLISSSLEYFYFNGNDLNVMWESDNNKYIHFFQNLTALKYLDISNNQLKSVKSEVLCNFPKSLEALTISNNLLKYFPWKNLSVLSNLTHLNLSRNFLTNLPDDVLEFGDSFSLLDLGHNYLTDIPINFFSKANSLQYLFLHHNQIKTLDQPSFSALCQNVSTLKKLVLHDNPFKCDCDTSWFGDLLRTTSVEIPQLTTHVRCEYPESQQGLVVLSVDKRSCQDIYGGLAFLACSFLAVTFTVLPLLHHLYSWDVWYCLQVLWAGHKGYSQLTGKDSLHHYDAFVVFDTKNQAVRDWVYNDLIVNLENCNHRKFSLCLEERDWIPGLSCIDNLHNAVRSSMKTVFVLSRDADGSEMVNGVTRQAFFMVQQRLLDEKVDAAVIVLLDEMFPKLKYIQLRKRLCGKSVLSWPRNPRAQPIFWNQMRMALSLDNLKLYDNKISESFM